MPDQTASAATIVCHRCWRVIADTAEDPCWELHWDDEPDLCWQTCQQCLEIYADNGYDRGISC